MAAASRIRRWTGNDDWRRTREGMNEPGVRALHLASKAVAAATDRLHRDLSRRRMVSAVEAALGIVGMTGLVTMAAGRGTGDVVLLIVFGLLAVVPLVDALYRATIGRPGALDSIAALERARTIEAHAASLTRLCGDIEDETGAPLVRAHLIERILSQVEQSSAALADREKRRSGTLDMPSRAHPRFKPAADRVVVRTVDGMTTIARLIDVSLSGASIAGVGHAKVGEAVHVGSREARVVRTTNDGFACVFDEPLERLAV